MLNTLTKYSIAASASVILMAVGLNTVQAHKGATYTAPKEPIQADVNVSYPPVYGRSPVEFFYTPIIGIKYTDVTGISNSFFTPEHPNYSINNTANVNKTELGGVIGLMIDGQYQIVSTSYWRAGFQSGLLYTSASTSDFVSNTCTPDCNYNNGTLEMSTIQLPILFTLSRYSAEDNYIVTGKLGPMVTYQMYEADLDGFDLQPTHETQIGVTIGLDGRYRLGNSDMFFLMGFDANLAFGDSNNSNFSGVNSLENILAYIGLSFS
jgi:hypothetical protein